jgi:tetratricopeptide (TPR) repeat protein
MISNLPFKAGRFILAAAFLCLFLVSCRSAEEKELEMQNQLADSISMRLNTPELKAVNEELKKDPGNAGLYNKRALVYLGIKETEAAVNDAKRAIRLDSTNAAYYLTLIDIHFSQNQTRQAKELLESVTKKFPENTEALLKLSELYFLVRQYQKGIDYVNKALRVDEHLARAYYIKGSIYRESGDTTRAISSLETAIEQDNKYVDAFHDLGIIYAAKKDPLALEYYNNALRINPSSQDLLYARAKLLQDLGKTEQAIAEYESLLKKFKTCDICNYNLGAIYLEIKKDNKKALEYFTKAIVDNPNYLEAYFARGYTYSKLNDRTNARADYSMCLKIQPNYEPAVEGLNDL